MIGVENSSNSVEKGGEIVHRSNSKDRIEVGRR